MVKPINLRAQLNPQGFVLRMHRPLLSRENPVVALKNERTLIHDLGFPIFNALTQRDLIFKSGNNFLADITLLRNGLVTDRNLMKIIKLSGFKTRETEYLKDKSIEDYPIDAANVLLGRMMRWTDENFILLKQFCPIKNPIVAKNVDKTLSSFKLETKNLFVESDYTFIAGLFSLIYAKCSTNFAQKVLPFYIVKILKDYYDQQAFEKYSKYSEMISNLFNSLFFENVEGLSRKILVDSETASIIMSKIFDLKNLYF